MGAALYDEAERGAPRLVTTVNAEVPAGVVTVYVTATVTAGIATSSEQPLLLQSATGLVPVFGTCAGMIVLARQVDGGEPLLGLMDIAVRRNAYGRQVDSFEADLDVRGIEHPVRGVFIRAPWIESVGARVETLATFEGRPVVLEEGNLLVASFHPELVGEAGLHRYLLKKVPREWHEAHGGAGPP